MVDESHDDLLVVLGCLIQKRILDIVIAKVENIASEHKNITRNIQRMLLDVTAILRKL